MLIPLGGDVFTASEFMNFVYDPKIAAQIAAYVDYISPVKGAKSSGEDRPRSCGEPAHLPGPRDALKSFRLRLRGA